MKVPAQKRIGNYKAFKNGYKNVYNCLIVIDTSLEEILKD